MNKRITPIYAVLMALLPVFNVYGVAPQRESIQLFVAHGGDDANTESQSAPLATLEGARQFNLVNKGIPIIRRVAKTSNSHSWNCRP